MEKKLEVRDLILSFRTVSGKVQAVRDISFDLYKGETLAIVGESGSGKSVTSKAILGILAGNSIIEGGEILYDGNDLLKISEDEFYRIRGNKIAMIFQDPLSSLNPIMRIGKQLTEAMLLKGKQNQKESRRTFNNLLRLLNSVMIEANGQGRAEELTQKCKKFDKFEFEHIRLEKAFNNAKEAATETVSDIDDTLFLIEKNAVKDPSRTLSDICKGALDSVNTYVVDKKAPDLRSLVSAVKKNVSSAIKKKDYSDVVTSLKGIKAILAEALTFDEPNFFAMGYYATFSGKPLPEMPVKELNVYLHKYLDDNFMLAFIADAQKAVELSAAKYFEKKETAVKALEAALKVLSADKLDRLETDRTVKELITVVEDSIDPLEIHKDNIAYTFRTSINAAVPIYFNGIEKNVKEKERYTRQKAKYDALVAKGKTPEWKVVPAAYVNLDIAKGDISRIVERLLTHYKDLLAKRGERDYKAETIAIIDFLKLNASGVVLKITKSMAKHKALKLLDEVGIPDPRRRYKQYPFEFSGGMRQRIVIAIALAANPDILICDEPTTALDVTIQAQILELINKIKAERNLSIIFITHDLGVVANMSDRIAVMYAGKIVEYGTSDDIFYHPAHPYTWALLSSMPDLDTNEKLESIPGTPPNMIYPPEGDAFADRNKYALKIDFEKQPPMFRISDTHSAATWLLHPDAPKVEMPLIVSERIERMNRRRAETDKEGGNINA